MKRAFATIVTAIAGCLLASVAFAQSAPERVGPASVKSSESAGRRWFVEIAPAGGGFSVARSAEVLSTPHFICDSSGVCSTDPEGRLDLKANYHYVVKPAISTGIVFRRLWNAHGVDNEDDFGVGVGTHLVFISGDGSSGSKVAPSLALHVGTQKTQFFAGVMFTPTDRVELPGGGTSATVPAGTDTARFLLPNRSGHINYFVGIVIGGVSTTSASRGAATEPAKSPGGQK